MKKKDVGSSICIFIILCLIYGGIAAWGAKGIIESRIAIHNEAQNKIFTTGDVKSVKELWVKGTKNRFGHNVYSATVNYKDEKGSEHQFKSRYYKTKRKPGERVEVLYNPSNSADVDLAVYDLLSFGYVPQSLDTNWWLLIPIIVGALCIIVFVDLLIRIFKEERSRIEGKLAIPDVPLESVAKCKDQVIMSRILIYMVVGLYIVVFGYFSGFQNPFKAHLGVATRAVSAHGFNTYQYEDYEGKIRYAILKKSKKDFGMNTEEKIKVIYWDGMKETDQLLEVSGAMIITMVYLAALLFCIVFHLGALKTYKKRVGAKM